MAVTDASAAPREVRLVIKVMPPDGRVRVEVEDPHGDADLEMRIAAAVVGLFRELKPDA